MESAGSCNYAIDFPPVTPGLARGSFAIEYDDPATPLFGTITIKKTVELREAGITSDTTHTAVRVSSGRIRQRLGFEVLATVADTSNAATVPLGGYVTFTDTFLGVTSSLNGGVGVPLSNGRASLNLIASKPGTHTLTAHYGGVDARFVASTGQALFSMTR